MTAFRTTAAALLALVLGLTSCSAGTGAEEADPPATSTQSASEPEPSEPSEPSESSEPPETEPQSAGGLASFYDQQVQWEPCEGGFECGTVEVPIDYDDPGGQSIALAVNRLPAGGDAIGSLVLNPGGPGASGVEYAKQAVGQFGTDVLESYDLVGFDPRGVGGSAPLDCLDTAGVDELLASDPNPDSEAEVADVQELFADFGEACIEDAGALLEHLSTTVVARDLDVIRAALGDEELYYLGGSYGTLIGALYAEQFPDRVGRLVLDGAVDPSLDLEEVNLVQAEGFETALRSYVEACVAQPACPLGDDLEEGITRVQDFLTDLDEDPLPTGSDRELTESLALYGIALPLYAPQLWTTLDQALTQAFEGDGATLLALADAYWRRTPDGYTENIAQVLYAVNCVDDPTDITVDEIEESIPRFEQVSPTFGRTFAWSQLACAQWPVEPAEPMPTIDGQGADPILVIGTTRDPATPYESAVALADQLESGVLLTREGDGHTAYGQGNSCIDSTVDDYLVDGTVPPPDKRC